MRKLTRGLIRFLPEAAARRLLISQMGKTTELATLPVEEAAMSGAKPLRFGPQGRGMAFEWGAGPLIVLVHGWGGRAAQMAPLAAALTAEGYRCVAPEITGHGAPGRHFTRWHYFFRDVEALAQTLRSEVFAYVGHSSGGTTMMAARRQGRVRAQRYICICSPFYPFLSIDSARNTFNASERLVEDYKLYVADGFGMAWNELEAGGSYAGAGENLLLVYGEKDKMVPHETGEQIHDLCPGSVLLKTKNHGHRSILSAAELRLATLDFLKERNTDQRRT